MPVQINEIIIRAVVDAPAPMAGAAEPSEIRSISEAAILELVLESIKEQSER